MPEKILVLGPAWVGDMVLAQSVFKTLKTNRPDCMIDVAAPTWTLPLLERMPEVSGKIPLPFKHGELAFWQRIKFGKSLKNAGYSQTIILTNSFKSALLPWAAGIPKRTSFLGEMRYGLINAIKPNVIAKGSDYSASQVVGGKEVQSWGGEIALIDLVEGRSTSNIIQKMNA